MKNDKKEELLLVDGIISHERYHKKETGKGTRSSDMHGQTSVNRDNSTPMKACKDYSRGPYTPGRILCNECVHTQCSDCDLGRCQINKHILSVAYMFGHPASHVHKHMI